MPYRTPPKDSKSASGNIPGRRNQIIIGVVISLFTVILCLAGIELIGFAWERKTAQGELGWTLIASRRLNLERRGSREKPYYLFKPNENYVWNGTPVSINSRGFRTEEVQIPKPDGVFRILNLGDSIAFGWEVNQEVTYGKQLETLLNLRNDGVNYEVINAGIPAWNLEAERNFLLQEGFDYQPDLVILDVTVVNDIYGGGPDISENQSLFQWLRDQTYSWPFLTTQMRFLIARQAGPEAIPVLNPPKNPEAYYPLSVDDPIWNEFWGFIEEMHRASQQREIPFMIVVFPTAMQLNSEDHPDVPQRVLTTRAYEAGVEIIDLLTPYENTCDAADSDSCEGYINLLFSDVWMHPNALGHKLAAQEILVQMENLIKVPLR